MDTPAVITADKGLDLFFYQLLQIGIQCGVNLTLGIRQLLILPPDLFNKMWRDIGHFSG